jgi:signal transduction histidine kinase
MYQPPLQKLSALVLPFSLWFTAALWLSVFLSVKLSKFFSEQREKRFFLILAAFWLVNGVVMLVTFSLGLRGFPVTGAYLETFVGLSSLLPAVLGAYYIYRYHYFELIIRQSFFFAIFATSIAVIYLYGIRSIDRYVQERFDLKPGTVEFLMILALVFAAGPIARLIDRTIERLFASEIGVYRQVAEQISNEAPRFGVISELVRYVETTVGRALELPSVRIILTDQTWPHDLSEAAVNDLIMNLRQSHLRFLDNHPSLAQLGASWCVPLWQEDQLVGVMLVKGPPSRLTFSKRTALPVLAAQIAIALRNCQLIEEKLRLERRLVEQERFAMLGQVAATIAHEVKNPLSSIKTIVQVMQEDEHLRSQYQRDLELIVKEIDRLSRTVAQLLSFSRPPAPTAEPATLQYLIEHAVTLLSPEAQKEGVQLKCEVLGDLSLSGHISAAMMEILSNLILNAIQATPSGGSVFVSGALAQDAQQKALKIAVTDEGEGIPPESRERVFEPFFTTKQRGTGLGLTIVKRRLAEIDGAMEIQSPVSNRRGTRMIITVPVSDQPYPRPLSDD